jgi:hypothetical protein
MTQKVMAASEGIKPISDRNQVRVIVKAVVRATEAWDLTATEAAALFDIPLATWNRMKSATFNGNLDRDKVTRASLIVGIYKGLRLSFNGPLAKSWPTLPNKGDFFGGRIPLEIMISGGILSMTRVRQHIDALLG